MNSLKEALEQKRKKYLSDLEETISSAIGTTNILRRELSYKILYLQGHRIDNIDKRIRKALVEEVEE